MGRRHRRRQHAALRRAVGLRRPARRVHGLPRRLQALDAGPPGRRVDRRRRQAGLPPGAADARAAHPPREGDVQHLHRAGAAGGDGQHVRRLPRPRRPDAASPAASHRLRRDPRRRAAQGSASHVGDDFFDTLHVTGVDAAGDPRRRARRRASTCARSTRRSVGISLDETTTRADVDRAGRAVRRRRIADIDALDATPPTPLPAGAARARSAFLTHPVFNTHHSETEMLRYMRALADKDLALDRTMIPLG